MLFSDTTTELEFNHASDLRMVIDHLRGFTFPEHSGSKIHEFFCLYIYLVGSFKLNKLSYPIRITSRESPDFSIICGKQNNEIGLEHTKATLESFKIAEFEAKKCPKGGFIELCYYSPFVKIPKKQSNVGIVPFRDSLEGKGWEGNQVENEWAEVILNAIKNKVELLNQPHFEVKKENNLFIEDDSPVSFVKREDDAIQILKQMHNQTNFSGKTIFAKVHIFSNCTLVYDVFGECIKVGLSKKELPNI